MSTTAVFIELLISGIQASIWVALLLFSITGYDWIVALIPPLEKWATLITAMAFASWYTLGIIVDRFASLLFIFFNPATFFGKIKFIESNLQRATKDTIRLEIIVKQGGALEYLEYFRSRGRVVRSTVFNLLLTTLAAVVFVVTRCNSLGCASSQGSLVLDIIGAGVLLIIISSIASAILELAYEQRVRQIEYSLEKTEKKSK